ncbi:MAG TPA: hypothetical protein VEA80_16440 [Vitreimonas sp.]|uniref:hypothetical protein n=1 Tax=Vitreimonas sp. TaxID=3069702 RepID=UPI002D41CB6A|nr:hypothetical protein [Vitreimonas sp.]HYD89067.1 hypothetical protein [Vitreimonas sp.]
MRIVTTALILSLTACASPLSDGGRRYTGVYAEGMETMTFRAEGGDETWAVVSGFAPLQAAAPPRADPRDGFSVCATIVGRLSPRGRYGHLGMFPREIEITEVIETRPGPCG